MKNILERTLQTMQNAIAFSQRGNKRKTPPPRNGIIDKQKIEKYQRERFNETPEI